MSRRRPEDSQHKQFWLEHSRSTPGFSSTREVGHYLENATMGHIHEMADNGTPGAILAWIYPTTGESPSLREGKFSGTLAEGEVTAERLAGPLKEKTTKELVAMLESGKAGVAVHTKQNPGGELWGIRNPKEHKK
jgi:hypothetical protein